MRCIMRTPYGCVRFGSCCCRAADLVRWIGANLDRFGSLGRLTLSELGMQGKVQLCTFALSSSGCVASRVAVAQHVVTASVTDKARDVLQVRAGPRS